MDLKELLGELYTDEVANKLKGVDIFEKGKAMPIEKFNSKINEVNTQKNELKEQVDTLNKTLEANNLNIEKFKKAAEGNEELQKQLQEYQEKVNNTQKEFSETLKNKETEWQQKEINNRKSYAIREKLLMEHADSKYIDLLMNQADISKVSENEGKMVGVDELVGELKTNFDKLFGKSIVKGAQAGTSNADVSIDKDSIKNMTTEQINQNWDKIQTVLTEK